MLATTEDFATRLASAGKEIDAALASLLDDAALDGELERPARLMAAMRHATLAGGKRLRPFLVVETARLFASEGQGVMRAAAAVEFVHCYSLVHDDLPAMDDDDLRRGRPTTHKAFDEATAILVGDALLTLSFDVLADPATDPDPAVQAALVRLLARASGLGGMVGGQLLDLGAEGRFTEGGMPLRLSDTEILHLQAMKTGALLAASVDMGAIIGRATAEERTRLHEFGRLLGQAFQIADDLLDVVSDTATLGKGAGKDAALGKGTLVGIWGVEAARTRLRELVVQAGETLAPFGARAEILRQAAQFVAERNK